MKNINIYKKEVAINKICKEKNWNPNNLTPQQRLFIVKSTEFK
jgi:hypothetical protein